MHRIKTLKIVGSICCILFFLTIFFLPLQVFAYNNEAQNPSGEPIAAEPEPAPTDNEKIPVCHTENATPTPTDNNLNRCDYKNSICLGSATKKLCQAVATLNGESGDNPYWRTANGIEPKLCQIPKEKYSFSKYLGAWIDAYLFNLGLAIGLVLILFAGILYMMSGADPGKANTAKDIIFTALTGLALIFLVKIIFRWVL